MDKENIRELLKNPRCPRTCKYDPEWQEEIQAGLRYKIHCIENDIPYLGFFDRVFNPEKPFAL